MSDDKSIKGTTDRQRINVHESYEVSYWTQALHCSKQQLIDAVDKVGPMAKDVRQHLRTAA